jgi:hypothetical protein
MVRLFYSPVILIMAIGRSQIPQQIYGKLRGAKPSRAMMAAKRKKKK